MNILEEVQQYVAGKLNADSQLSACQFLVENKKDIDYEIKNTLGKQGIVGLVMTPKATFAGAFMDVGLSWQIDELEVDIVENVAVNRGKKDGYVTGQDAAMRLFDVMCPLSGEGEGQFSPVSYQEGEDGNLLVNKCLMKCLVHKDKKEPAPPDPRKTRLTYDDGRVVELALSGTIYQGHLPDMGHIVAADIGEDVTLIGESAFNLCYELTSVTLPKTSIAIAPFAFNEIPLASLDFGDSGLTEIGMAAFEHCERLTAVVLPSTLSSMGPGAFVYCPNIDLSFIGKTLYEIKSMDNYSWGIADTSQIHSIIGPDTRVKYAWSTSWDSLPLSGTLNSDDLPSRDGINYVGIGSSIDEIGYSAFSGMEFLIGVEIPNTVTTIGTRAFAGAEGMPDIKIPNSVSSIGSDAFYGCNSLSSVMFDGKTIEQVQAMDNYPWGIVHTDVIHAEL